MAQSIVAALKIGARSISDCAEHLHNNIDKWPYEYRVEIWSIIVESDLENFANYKEEFISELEKDVCESMNNIRNKLLKSGALKPEEF